MTKERNDVGMCALMHRVIGSLFLALEAFLMCACFVVLLIKLVDKPCKSNAKEGLYMLIH